MGRGGGRGGENEMRWGERRGEWDEVGREEGRRRCSGGRVGQNWEGGTNRGNRVTRN